MPKEDTHIEVGFFGGSFTGLPLATQRSYLQRVEPFIKEGRIAGIRLSTRPDYINDEILTMLKKHTVSTIELGVQSMVDTVLTASKRGHTFEDIKKASELIIKYDLRLGHQIMVGLPKSTLRDEIKSAKLSIDMRVNDIRIYPLIVIRNTELADMFNKGQYAPLDETEAVERCAKLILLFEGNNINIIRCGLHPSEGLITGTEILAGPFHEAFRQKVETHIYRMLLSTIPNIHDVTKISYSPRESAYIIGYNRKNRDLIEASTGKKRIFYAGKSVKTGHLIVAYNSGAKQTFTRSMLLKGL